MGGGGETPDPETPFRSYLLDLRRRLSGFTRMGVESEGGLGVESLVTFSTEE